MRVTSVIDHIRDRVVRDASPRVVAGFEYRVPDVPTHVRRNVWLEIQRQIWRPVLARVAHDVDVEPW